MMLCGIMADRGNGRVSALRCEARRLGQGCDGVLAKVLEVVDLVVEKIHPSHSLLQSLLVLLSLLPSYLVARFDCHEECPGPPRPSEISREIREFR